MGIGGVFRQHFTSSGNDRESRIWRFTPSQTTGEVGYLNSEISNILTTNAQLVNDPATADNTTLTLSVWIYPRKGTENFEGSPANGGHAPHTVFYQLNEDTDDASTYLQITGDYNSSLVQVRCKFVNRTITHSVNTIYYDQWNHILISIDADSNTANDKVDLVINGTRYSKGSSGLTISGSGNMIIDPDNDFNLCLGFQPTSSQYTEGSNAFNGEIYQFYFDDVYYDMTNSANIALFRNGSSSVPNSHLPNQTPLVLLTDFNTFNSGTNDPGTVTRFGITTSNLSKP